MKATSQPGEQVAAPTSPGAAVYRRGVSMDSPGASGGRLRATTNARARLSTSGGKPSPTPAG